MMTRDMYLNMHYIFVKKKGQLFFNIIIHLYVQTSTVESFKCELANFRGLKFVLFCFVVLGFWFFFLVFLGGFFAYSWGCVNLGVRRFLVLFKKKSTFLRFFSSRMLILGGVPNANITSIKLRHHEF